MAAEIVTIGGSGTAQWVMTSDGAKYNMGPISVLKFVQKLARGAGAAKAALNQFNKTGQTMLAVDLDKMWALFPYRRSRWASDGSFMSTDQRIRPTPTGDQHMTTILDDLKIFEGHLAKLNKQAGEGQKASAEDLEVIAKLAQKIKSPNQSNNSTYYGYGTDLFEVGDTPPKPHTVGASGIEGLSYDTFAKNTEVANEIIAKAESTVETIDKLITAGKKFNAARAKGDVHAVTSKIAGILKDVDLTQPWVQADLDKLAGRMSEIHGLFAGAE